MKKVMMTLMTVAFSVSAFAEKAKDTRVESRVRATGREQAIRLSTSQCSYPSPIPLIANVSFAVVSSDFEYKVCREYVTSDYEVTGSFWDKSAKEITGTARISYRLESASRGSSQSLFESRKGQGIDPLQYSLAVSSAVNACNSMRQLVLQNETDLSNTNCR